VLGLELAPAGRVRQDPAIDDTTTSSLIVAHRSIVTEEQIDHLGHMNVRFYGVNAHAATAAVLDAIGLAPNETEVVDAYTRHHREQLLGAPLAVRSGLLEVGAADLRVYHELANEDTGVLAATFVHRVRCAGEQRGLPLPDRVSARSRELTTTIPRHGASRSISIQSDPIATAPPLPALRDGDLALRKPRGVSTDECTPDGAYVRTMAPMLVWGGESVDRRMPEMLHTTRDGRRMGWASMETRLAIHRLPRAGDHIQSFSAVLALRDKTSHRILWAYDVERQDLLVSFEIVNLAFDIAARSPMTIPDDIRAAEHTVLRPDLAPRPPSGA